MGSRSRNKQPVVTASEIASEPHDDVYRSAIAFIARSLVADLFGQHETCTRRECRLAGRCQGYMQGGFCPVEMDNRQAFLFAGMMAFHDVLRGEIDGFQRSDAAP